jgi:uncharacterized membrane protein YtjA (UPF0391 family)
MTMLKMALTFLVLSAIALLLVPLAVAKVLGLAFACLFVVFLLLGLATVDTGRPRARGATLDAPTGSRERFFAQ